MSDTQAPTCPGCGTADRVEPMGPHAYAWTPRDPLPDAADLERWFCAGCLGCLSALPALPAADAVPPLATGQGAKQRRRDRLRREKEERGDYS
jgi:hypothetical protein